MLTCGYCVAMIIVVAKQDYTIAWTFVYDIFIEAAEICPNILPLHQLWSEDVWYSMLKRQMHEVIGVQNVSNNLCMCTYHSFISFSFIQPLTICFYCQFNMVCCSGSYWDIAVHYEKNKSSHAVINMLIYTLGWPTYTGVLRVACQQSVLFLCYLYFVAMPW